MTTKTTTEQPQQPSPPPTVHQAWAAVQGDVLSVRKDQQVTAGPARFSFRGIDGVMNAVGPALRAHGVHIRPVQVDVDRRDTKTSGGKDARETCVMVTYEVTGPAGDSFDGMAPGESLDNGDKGTAKAMSVAYRTFLLQALTIPTDETDPDATTYQREAPARPAGSSRDFAAEIAACTTTAQLRALWPQLPPQFKDAANARGAQLKADEAAQQTPNPITTEGEAAWPR